MNKLISVVIPVYNEEETIGKCLETLSIQNYKPLEIIIVDDGSTDNTISIVKNYQQSIANCKLLYQKHLGPGPARNFGSSKANGDILVFVDADMHFDKNFIRDLTRPIIERKTIGTFSKNELVSNKEHIWSICWNINRNVPYGKMLPDNYPDTAPVFRAILKKEFDKVNGFDSSGEYTDDWSLSRKLKKYSTMAKGAYYYHTNPASLYEVFKQSRWIGKNEFITGNLNRKIRSLIYYSLPFSLAVGFYKSTANFKAQFLLFKLVYDFGVWKSVVMSFMGEKKAK